MTTTARSHPLGRPDDALATTARYFVERGNYRRGEPWGREVRAPDKRRRQEIAHAMPMAEARRRARRRQAFPLRDAPRKLWVPVPAGRRF